MKIERVYTIEGDRRMKIKKILISVIIMVTMILAFRIGVQGERTSKENELFKEQILCIEKENLPELHINIFFIMITVLTAAFVFCIYLAKKNDLLWTKKEQRKLNYKEVEKTTYAQGAANG